MKNIEIFQIKLANNIRMEENEDLPRSSQLGAKNSNFFGEISYNPSQILSTKYTASTKNNLTEINYENLIASISLNNFVTTFDYLNEIIHLKQFYLKILRKLILMMKIAFSFRQEKINHQI